MNKAQQEAILELRSALAHCEAENLVVVVERKQLTVADYKALDANGFFEGEAAANAQAISATEHHTIPTVLVQIHENERESARFYDWVEDNHFAHANPSPDSEDA